MYGTSNNAYLSIGPSFEELTEAEMLNTEGEVSAVVRISIAVSKGILAWSGAACVAATVASVQATIKDILDLR
jgi:hypothetical protein